MCFDPITLKSGEVVPCGKCLECYQARRNDWSVRLQLHTLSYDRMPLFVTLTYAPEHLPESGVSKKHFQDFIKRIRDKYNLYNTNFSFAGCGEYGDLFGRAHYHVLMFGMTAYNDSYDVSDELCRIQIEDDWSFGECFVCVAEWSGIHYVTKYCLKFLEKDWDSSQEKPFFLCSKGIGKGFESTSQFAYIKNMLSIDKYRRALDSCPELDWTNNHTLLASSNQILSKLQPFVECNNIVLPSGKKALLPRYFRKKLFGSYEHWSFNPLAYYRFCQKINRYARDSINGFKRDDRILIKQQQIAKKMFQRGHLVKPTKNFMVK